MTGCKEGLSGGRRSSCQSHKDTHSRSDTTTHTDLDWAVNEQWEDSLEEEEEEKPDKEKKKKITKLHIHKHCRFAQV